MPYNLLTTNCHCFVAHFLNEVGYRWVRRVQVLRRHEPKRIACGSDTRHPTCLPALPVLRVRRGG